MGERNDIKYKQWKKNHDDKIIARRTRRKERIRKILSYMHYQNYLENLKAKEEEKSLDMKSRKVYSAPTELSLITNPYETIEYFNLILNNMANNKIKKINIDLEKVKILTIDAIMYMLAIITNFRQNTNIYVFGNAPTDIESRDIFFKSGFYNFVNSRMKTIPDNEKNRVSITTGNNVNNDAAARICDFVNDKFGTNYRNTKYLYGMLIELMKNTFHHAYTVKGPLVSCWYLYADYDKKLDIVRITFIDTGEGIPRTVAKKGTEKIEELFSGKIDNKLMISAFNGDDRTRTNLENRGTGLPEIYEAFNKNKILNLKVISCKGHLDFNNLNVDNIPTDMKSDLQGTVYYWEMINNK